MIIKTFKSEYDFNFVEILTISKKKYSDEYKAAVNRYKKKYNKLVKSLEEFKFDDAENIEFCEFKLGENVNDECGVYLWVINGKIKYIGETKNLKARFNNGYGHITPRNVFYKGQSTNCKMNRIALECFNNGQEIKIYFLETKDYKNVEKDLLNYNRENNLWELYNLK